MGGVLGGYAAKEKIHVLEEGVIITESLEGE